MSRIYLGQSASIEKIFTEEEVSFYCEKISHDKNPLHFSKIAARERGFEDCLVPGPMISCLFGGLLGSKLPGDNTIYLGQETKFIRPVYIGEKIRAVIKITNIREDKPIAIFETIIIKENGEIAVEGNAVVKF